MFANEPFAMLVVQVAPVALKPTETASRCCAINNADSSADPIGGFGFGHPRSLAIVELSAHSNWALTNDIRLCMFIFVFRLSVLSTTEFSFNLYKLRFKRAKLKSVHVIPIVQNTPGAAF